MEAIDIQQLIRAAVKEELGHKDREDYDERKSALGSAHAGKLGKSRHLANECASIALPPKSAEVADLAERLLHRKNALHEAIASVCERFGAVTSLPPVTKRDTGPCVQPTLTPLGSTLADVVYGIETAIDMLVELRQSAQV